MTHPRAYEMVGYDGPKSPAAYQPDPRRSQLLLSVPADLRDQHLPAVAAERIRVFHHLS